MDATQQSKKHPSGLYALCFAEMWDRFSFYGTTALLILYLTHVFSFPSVRANDFYSTYEALSFALPVLGGLLADRVFGFEQSIILGALFIIIGNVILAIPAHACLYLGLSLSVAGMGLFKGNITSFVGLLYKPKDTRRDSGFTIFYMGMNTGAIAGPIVFGLIAHQWGWHYCFALSAILMSSGLAAFLAYRKRFVIHHTPSAIKNVSPKKIAHRTRIAFFYALILITAGLIVFLFIHPALANKTVAVFSIIAMIGVAMIALRRPALERNHILALIFLSLFAVLYFACSLQTGSSMTLFIDHYVDRHLLGFKIPTMMFSSLDPFFTIALAPFFVFLWGYLSRKRAEPSVTLKLFLGLLLSSASFAVFSLAAHPTPFIHQHQMLWIVLGNLLLGAGELVIVPPLMSAVSRFAPPDLLGTLMGMWFLSLALSGYVGSVMAKLAIRKTTAIFGETLYRHAFLEISAIMLGASVIVFITIPWLKRMMKETSEGR